MRIGNRPGRLGTSETNPNCFGYVGGLVGVNEGAVQITDSFATDNTADWDNSSGFFVGQIWGTDATFANDYYLARAGQPDPASTGVSSATAAQLASTAFAVYHGITPWDFDTTWEMVDGLPELIIVLAA